MFSKRNLVDVKKSISKIQDPKKDLTTRIKHLKVVLENVETSEAKGLFEANFSHVFNILYDSFIQSENNLRQRVHKAHKEELECTLWILEQILCLLPELIHKRWHLHSLKRILSKLLHPANTIKLRRQAIRYFLLWYQALNDNAPECVHEMFASLVPGINGQSHVPLAGTSVFHENQMPVMALELLPILPSQNAVEKSTTEHSGRFFLEALLESMAQTVVKLEWQDKSSHYHRCFAFLLDKFKVYYLAKICPNFSWNTSLYRPNLELPTMRRIEIDNDFVSYRITLIMWITSYVHQTKKSATDGGLSFPSLSSQDNDESTHPSLDSTISIRSTGKISDEEIATRIVREVLYSTRDNINFLHEMFRQAFLVNFTHVIAVRRVILLYKDLIQGNVPELPVYMLEPPEDQSRCVDNEKEPPKIGRLRNVSYLGAIQRENLLVRAGMQNVYQLFVTHAANVFLLETSQNVPKMLEEQTDACKRVLNIYRYMVMNTKMSSNTWEQLLLVLLQITSLVLGEKKKSQQSLGGKLAPAIFQTLIVTWIKANLNVLISKELWDRFLYVLTSLTNWEELIKEWAKTLETLTRVLARHVYNLDLNDLPLDRLNDQKSKRGRRPPTKSICSSSDIKSTPESRPGSCSVDSNSLVKKRTKTGLSRSYSETNLNLKRKTSQRRRDVLKHRRSLSLDNLHPVPDTESTDRTRSPSPAPSSGLESNSIKDSPLQLDVIDTNSLDNSGEHRGVICGGTVRGWLPDVAVILWKRMLGALGDVNAIADPKLHAQIFDHFVKLTDTLIKIKQNQGISHDNQSTPQAPELVPPLTLILPWCFEAMLLPNSYEKGKLTALRLLCTIITNSDFEQKQFLSHFYRFLHLALTSNSTAYLNTSLQYLGPRFLSLQLPGSLLLILDIVHACNSVLNCKDNWDTSPRKETVSIVANLLSLPNDLSSFSVLQPEPGMRVISCPDIKEHVVSILLRAGKQEPTGKARCVALSALGIFIYKELTNKSFHPKVADAIDVILITLKLNNKSIANLASNILYLLCDHASTLWIYYPKHASNIIRTLCDALFLHLPHNLGSEENEKALVNALLICLGEWCMRLEPSRLLEETDGKMCLLLQVFTVLHEIIIGSNHVGKDKTKKQNDDFDPNIVSDDMDQPSSLASSCSTTANPINTQNHQAIVLCAKTVLAHLVTHSGHFPMAIGAARLSSLVVEHDDVPNLNADELSANIFQASNIQLFMLTKDVIASFIELPMLELPGGGITAGFSTSDRQVRVLLRNLSGKACWDASILHRIPSNACYDPLMNRELSAKNNERSGFNSFIQPESLMIGNVHFLPQRAMRHRPPNILPDTTNDAPDLDQLNDLLQYLGHTSPECLENSGRKLNEPANPPMALDIEREAMASVISERNLEIDEVKIAQCTEAMLGQPISRPTKEINTVDEDFNAFRQCRLLFSQMGLATWERRQQLHLLAKTERLLRELRNLDGQRCRETHKVAVVYVAYGQEDRNSILSNQSGSVAYEHFLSALAWEVELEGHTGFLGGLHRQGSTGLTAPYVATSFSETIFHVATRMPGDTPETILNKTRHLGNDEVHIVWSEHNRDYRRDIIPTEFCDILIVIYPLGNNLNRITINCKPEVPHFGILFDEAIVETNILAGLIRAAAICGSRAKRTTLPLYQQYYEERARSLDTVMSKHKHSTTFEEFISRVYSPIDLPSPFGGGVPTSAGGSSGGGGATHGVGDGSTGASNLAAALLDSHQRPRTDTKYGQKGVWFHSNDVTMSVESTSISPRPLKKISTNLKSIPRKSLRQDNQSDSPPESPPQTSLTKK